MPLKALDHRFSQQLSHQTTTSGHSEKGVNRVQSDSDQLELWHQTEQNLHPIARNYRKWSALQTKATYGGVG